jgi:Uri superfamily endonuclease
LKGLTLDRDVVKRRQISAADALRASKHPHPIICIGDESPGGAYVLRIRVAETISVVFGRFKMGKAIELPAGDYLYVGSALRGLARRLLRHATRSGQAEPHAIRDDLIGYFISIGVEEKDLISTRSKTLHWNIDHLLDNAKAELSQILVIRSSQSLEAGLAKLLEREPGCFILERGLGASDVRGNTHLLGVKAGEMWWQTLPEKLTRFHTSAAVAVRPKAPGSHPQSP